MLVTVVTPTGKVCAKSKVQSPKSLVDWRRLKTRNRDVRDRAVVGRAHVERHVALAAQTRIGGEHEITRTGDRRGLRIQDRDGEEASADVAAGIGGGVGDGRDSYRERAAAGWKDHEIRDAAIVRGARGIRHVAPAARAGV